METEQAKARIDALLKDVEIRMGAREDKLRQAWQRIDQLNEVFGLPYRPDWAQPLRDEWNDMLRDLREVRALMGKNG